MNLDMQEQTALCLLASSLHNAPGTRRVVDRPPLHKRVKII
jgi:hypothetical protein